jgi:hypothetical protein
MRRTMATEPSQPHPEVPLSWLQESYRDFHMQIGRALRQEYELPQELPDRLLTLLMELTGQEESN